MRTLSAWTLVLSFLCACAAGAAPRNETPSARAVLDATGIRGGLVVHLGCGDGRLTAALRANDAIVVHGLDADVAKARAHIRSLGLYGPVSVDQWKGDRLPYADNTVNLLVAEDPGKVPTEEMMRVLCPDGVLYSRKGGTWTKSVKPRPEGVDEWTHFLHDASGNPVARDRVLGPPRHAQWVEGPRHGRGHEYTPSVAALVASAGRIFYLADDGPTSSVYQPAQWQLTARDAHNGLLLWKQPVATWWPVICGWTQGPRQLQRKLVAVGDRVYVTLGMHAPLVALDAATGKKVRDYPETDGADEIVYHQGVLLLAVRAVTEERTGELARWAQLARERESPLFVRDTAEPLVKALRGTENKAAVSLLALDAAGGSVLWKRPGSEIGGLRPLSLSAAGDRAFYQGGGKVVCLDLKTGKEAWRAACSVPMRVVSERGVVCADAKTVTLLSLQTGEPVWREAPVLSGIRDAFVIGDSLWLGGFKPFETKNPKHGPEWGPYFAARHDLVTGKLLGQVEPENPGHHHRCYVNKATERYILGGRRGTEFIDLQTGEVLWNSFARGVCMYGIMPANGLLYVPPHSCGCYTAAKLMGFNALAPGSSAAPPTPDTARLETGPASGPDASLVPVAARPARAEWPTYRADAGRSGTAPGTVPAGLHPRWQVKVGGRLTSLTVAEGRVLAAATDEHRVCALDAETGKSSWEFTAGARVDSPPTVYGGRAIFGARDGCVYSVRASDGALAWKLQAARAERRIPVCGQLESASPVHGSVLVRDGTAYATAGRSSYLDGGIDLLRIDARRGKILSRTAIYSPDPETGKQPAHTAPAYMPGARSDILSSDDQHVYLRDSVFDRDGGAQPQGKPHLFTLTDFLDDTWPHRSYWIFGTQCSLSTGCSGRAKDLVYGRLISFTDATIYGYGRKGVHWSNQFEDGPYRVFAVNRGDGKELWSKPVPIQVRAMVLAGKVLFLAGPPPDPAGLAMLPDAAKGGLVVALDAADGSELGRCDLGAEPVFDGMAAAYGRLYLTTTAGTVVCLEGAK